MTNIEYGGEGYDQAVREIIDDIHRTAREYFETREDISPDVEAQRMRELATALLKDSLSS